MLMGVEDGLAWAFLGGLMLDMLVPARPLGATTLTLLLMLLRRIPEAERSVRAGGWSTDDVRPIERLSDLTVGMVGFGRIARRLARALLAMDITCAIFDPYLPQSARQDAGSGVRFVDDLRDLLPSVDALTLHCPLTPDTRQLIGPDELRLMPSHAVLVNTSRGPLIDADALIEALRTGELRAAALDVVDPEPPADPAELAAVPGLHITPHMAYYSEAALRESQRKAATQVVKALTGRPLDYQVN
jgi:D-3-phosphoglycerate dehydrogenase